MEKDSIFPEIKLFEPLEVAKRVGRFVLDRLYSDFPATLEREE